MVKKQISKDDRRKAKSYAEEGTQAYLAWDIEQAVRSLEEAVQIVPDDADYRLQLARALARSGDYDRALRMLAAFMRLEPESPLAERFEQLFASGMDEVEKVLTDRMTEAEMSIEEIGAALQMWLEYRVALGRAPLTVRKPQTWAAALDYIVRKVNLRPVKRDEIAEFYDVSDSAVRDRHQDLIKILDVMPCDYRYFTGEENPLDKLVEAAELLEELEARFRAP